MVQSQNDGEAFAAWCDQFDAIARTRGCDFDFTRVMGRECYRNLFDDGFTPRDAFEEELSAAAGDLDP